LLLCVVWECIEDNVKGIKSSNTNYAKSETEVEFDEEKVKLDQIIKQIKETGYKAQQISSQ
jgi:copper chaperone CopZ